MEFAEPNGTVIQVERSKVANQIVPRPNVPNNLSEKEVLLKGTYPRHTYKTMTLTPELWNIVVAVIQSIHEAPAWLKRQSRLNYKDITQLPSVDVAGDSVDVIPSVEKRLLKADYFDFLREQINLEPRGPEWGKILKVRLAHLEPFVRQWRFSPWCCRASR